MAKKKKEEEEKVYHVEVITKARVTEDCEWEYLVKWAGYDSDADTWEPSENVQQCDRLLESFWIHIGMDNKDYPVGYEMVAEEEWIKKEKRYYEETFVKPPKRKKERQERLNSKTASSIPRTFGDLSSSDEGSAAKTSATTKKSNKKVPAADLESESESESDGHFCKQAKVTPRPKATTPPLKPPKAGGQEPRSTVHTSSSIVPPKATAVRTHQDQRSNPLVKAMDLPPKSVEAGSSLSTKQRIAAGIPLPPPGPKLLPLQTKKSSLSLLSFKKNKPPPLPSNPVKDTATTGTSATPTTPVARPADTLNDAETAASPQPMDTDQSVDFLGSISDGEPTGGSPEIVAVPIPPKSQEEIGAEKFLQTIHIPALSGPMEIDATLDRSDVDLPKLESTKTSVIPKIPKKWKWSGELFINTSENKTELLCAVTIADPGGTSNSSYINLLLSPLDSLQISKLYPILLLSPLIRACGKPQYFGRLQSNEPGDEVVIHGMEHHLTSEGLVAAIPLLLDGAEVAILLVFPSAQQGLTSALQVPECLLSGTHLLVVLLPFLVSVKALSSIAGLRSIETVMHSSFYSLDVPVPPQEALLYQGMSLLSFPKALLDFLNNPSTARTYCIWPMPDQLSLDLDTTMLQGVLKSTKAVPARLEEDTRAIFISNSHLDVLHTMPSLVAKRVNSPEVQFWTYGYSNKMANESWRVQEIYPLGGIVTFTSSALRENLLDCYHLISQIIDHPLWDCYIIPEVLALAQQLLCDDEDLACSESCLGPILDFVVDGLISVIRMPDKGHSGPAAQVSQTFGHCNASGQELLDVCFEILRSHPSTLEMTSEQLITLTNNEVTRDLLNAQIQPAFMERFRRFVVIRAASEDSIPFDKDGLEWIPLSLFSFKDDYFQQ